MFLTKLANFLLGYVVFSARGGFSERFFNLCSNNNIFIWDVKREGDCIFGCVDAGDYKALRDFAKKTGMKIRAEKKVGLPFILFHNKARFALPVAAVVFAVVFFVSSKFIWTVEVSGNVNVPSEDIISAFEQLGVKPGVPKKSLEVSEIADRSLLLLDGIEWSSVNINGSSATIEVKEKIPVPEMRTSSDVPSNIISTVGGVVKRIDLYKGTKCVNVGDAVMQGDVLVAGAVTNKDTSVSFCEAQAYVAVQTSKSVTSSIKKERLSRVYKKTKKRFVLSFFSLEIPLNFLFPSEGNCDCFESDYFLESNGKKLPLGIICQRYDYYETKPVSYEDNIAILYSVEQFMSEISDTFSDKLILSQSTKVGKDEVCGVFEVVMSAGEPVEMNVEFAENDSDDTIS